MLVTRPGPIKVRRELIEAAEDITRPPPCRDIHCVSHAGFRASVCFQVYNPEFFGPEDFIANDTMGNGWRVGLKKDIIICINMTNVFSEANTLVPPQTDMAQEAYTLIKKLTKFSTNTLTVASKKAKKMCCC